MYLYLLLLLLSVVSTTSRNLPGKQFFGYNVVNLQSGNFSSDAAYAIATKSLNVGILRYPGGNLADFWNWRTGWCVNTTSANGCPKCKNPCVNKSEKRIYRLEEFQIAIQATDATSVLMMNMLTSNIQDQLEFLSHAQSIGILQSGTYIELGGEFYWGKYSQRWNDGKIYATEANVWATAIKAQFPDVRVMAVAAHSTANQSPQDRGYMWNGLVYSTLNTKVVDGVTLHPYLHLDNTSGGNSPLQPGVPPRTKGQGPTGWFNSATVQQQNVDFLNSESGIEKLLGVPFFVATSALGNEATHQPLPADLRMIITETNVMERAGPLKLSWLHGLFMSATVFNLLSVRQIDAVLLHVLLNGYGWGALYETDQDFHGPFGGIPPQGSMSTALGKTGCLVAACNAIKTKSYMPTALGVALGALSSGMVGANKAIELDFNGTRNPIRSGMKPSGLVGTISYPSLYGFMFQADTVEDVDSSSQNATVLNLGPTYIQYMWKHEKEGSCVKYTSWTTPGVSGSPLAWVSTTEKVNVTSIKCDESSGGVVIFPPYSITTVQFRTKNNLKTPTPPKFATEFTLVYNITNYQYDFEVYGKWSVDHKNSTNSLNLRERQDSWNVTLHPKITIKDFKKHVMMNIDPTISNQNHKCITTIPNNVTQHAWSLPDNACLVQVATEYKRWRVHHSLENVCVDYWLNVQDQVGILPYRIAYFGNCKSCSVVSPDEEVLVENHLYSNFTFGDISPSIFNIPSNVLECKKAGAITRKSSKMRYLMLSMFGNDTTSFLAE